MRYVALIVAVLGLLAPRAVGAEDAQWTFNGIQPDSSEWGFSPGRLPIAQSHIDHYAEVLQLDEGQQAALKSLLETMASQYKQAWVAYSENVADANARTQASQSWQTQQSEMSELREAFRDKKEKLVDSLFDDLRLFLTPEQEKRWMTIERDRRRSTTLVAYACFDEESIDLVSAADALNISDDERAALQPILDRYADALDSVLQMRNRKSEALAATARKYQQVQMEAYAQGPDVDQAKMMKAQQELQEITGEIVPQALEVREASRRVRDVNRQYLDELSKAIPASAADDWKKATKPANSRRNPWEVYSRANTLFKMIENLDDMKTMAESQMSLWDSDEANEYLLMLRSVEPLTSDQRQRVESIHDDYTAAIDRLEREHSPASASSSDEPRTATIPTTAGTITLSRIDPADPNANPYAYYNRQEDPEQAKKRAEIEQDAIDRVRKVLTLNQRAIVAHF